MCRPDVPLKLAFSRSGRIHCGHEGKSPGDENCGDQTGRAHSRHGQRHLDRAGFRRASRRFCGVHVKLPVLLDTHAFLWWCEDSPKLSKKARKVMTERDCFVSYASFWEIAIKVSLNKLRLPGIVDRYLADQMSLNGFEQLEIGFRQIMRCSSLERRHGDPFDRLLVAQAREKSLPIVSRDAIFDAYGVKRIW